jgi:hypothetical protein
VENQRKTWNDKEHSKNPKIMTEISHPSHVAPPALTIKIFKIPKRIFQDKFLGAITNPAFTPLGEVKFS